MLSTVVGAVGTFALSLILAYGLLRLRCRKIGPPFGPRARYWAFFIVMATAVVSAGMGLIIVAVSHHDRAAFVGIIVPGGLWFRKMPPERDRDVRPRTLSSLLTLPFSQLYERLGEDMQDWCDTRLRAAAVKPQLISDAASWYYNQVRNQLGDSTARADLESLRNSIMHKISIEQMINLDTTPARVWAALQAHPATEDIRGYTDADLPRLAQEMEAESVNELLLLLAYLYRLGFYNILIVPFRPPPRRDRVQRGGRVRRADRVPRPEPKAPEPELRAIETGGNRSPEHVDDRETL